MDAKNARVVLILIMDSLGKITFRIIDQIGKGENAWELFGNYLELPKIIDSENVFDWALIVVQL